MSHITKHFTFPEDCDKASVQAKCNHLAEMDDWQEGCSGVSSIRWLGHILCNSYEEAEEEVKKQDRGWYDCLAVRYRENEPTKSSKSTQNASERVNEAQKAYNSLKIKVESDFATCKSEFIGCKSCGSKLNRKLLKTPACPLCGQSLLSPTALDRLEKAKERIKKAQIALSDSAEKDEKKRKKTGKIRWLVKIEYHV